MKKSALLSLAIATLTGSALAQDVVTQEALNAVKGQAGSAAAQAGAASAKAAGADAKAEAASAKVDSVSEKVDAVKGKLDGLEESYLETKATVDKLAKIKVSGMVQARYEYATDTTQLSGLGETQSRFRVRRGRLKVAHEGTLGDFAVQAQYGEKGIELVDMYGTFQDPWKVVKVRVGAQDIPFGYEIGHSSGSMETMERSLAEQKLFNGEKDLGAVVFLAYNKGIFENIDFKAGVMNGNMNVKTEELNDGKAILGRLGFKLPVPSANFAIDGGASYYYNHTTTPADSVFDYAGQLADHKASGNTNIALKSKYRSLEKSILGADVQVYFNVLPFGGTVLRGEMYTGDNVSVANNGPYDGGTVAYTRPTLGWYGTLVQNLGSDFQVVGRYEQYDPNTELEGDAIGKGKIGDANDIAWSQISVGVNYFLSGNVKLSLAYDIKTNETSSNLTSKDVRKDYTKEIDNNLLTAQLLYKF